MEGNTCFSLMLSYTRICTLNVTHFTNLCEGGSVYGGVFLLMAPACHHYFCARNSWASFILDNLSHYSAYNLANHRCILGGTKFPYIAGQKLTEWLD